MAPKRSTPFKISSMDSLGQGVSKETEKITFIAKTITGDAGDAVILSEKKGVAFGRIARLAEASPLRIPPVCPHFDACPSCHYLHVDYPEELRIKKGALEKLFRKLVIPEVIVVPALRRLGYRNRLQLHYDLQERALGYFDHQLGKIVPVPNCLMGVDSVGTELRRLYRDAAWEREVPRGPARGHVEIYQTEAALKVSWNRPYAEGGFTQVFQEMNQKLLQLLQETVGASAGAVLDLFGGNGNLSQPLSPSRRLCVDVYPDSKGREFFNQNLYADGAFRNVKQELRRRSLDQLDTLILDPPRSGFKDLPRWLAELRPKTVAYVSCDPHTLVRDVQGVSDYEIKKVYLVDFFPSTFHFESFIILERKG